MELLHNTPIIYHFTNLNLDAPEHFNQSMMLRSSKRINMYTLKTALGMLCKYHDMLRAVWADNQLMVRDVQAGNLYHIEEHCLRNSSYLADDMLPLCNNLQSSINLSEGPLMRVAVFHLAEQDVVLVVIHHLVVDGVSWRILIEDLNKIYSTLLQGKLSVSLPKRKCSFQEYAQAIAEYAESTKLAREKDYWHTVAKKINSTQRSTAKPSYEYLNSNFRLDKDATHALTGRLTRHYNAEINTLLLTALSRAWKEVTKDDCLDISLEGHGREPFGDKPLSLERLVGWFTIIYPVALDYKEGSLEEHIAETDAMLKAIPNKGFGYGVLTYQGKNPELVCEPKMTFNYLGAFEEHKSDSIFAIENTLPQGSSVNSKNHSDTPLSINCAVVDGCLIGALSYDKGIMEPSIADALCQTFVGQINILIN